jgi:Lhr-like helicase
MYLLILIVVFATIFAIVFIIPVFLPSPTSPPKIEIVMDLDAFFKMRDELVTLTNLQLENVRFAGDVFQLEGRVQRIEKGEKNYYKIEKSYEALYVFVEVCKGNKKCLVSWTVEWDKRYYDKSIDYQNFCQGSQIIFKGKVMSDQGSELIKFYKAGELIKFEQVKLC